MKRKLSTVLPPNAFKDKVVVPFPEARAERPGENDRPGQMFKFRLRNGFIGQVSVSEKVADLLWSRVQAPDEFHYIIIFDSFTRRIALNLQQVVASQFDYIGESGLEGIWIDESEMVDIYFADSPKPLILEIDADEMTTVEFDEGGERDNDLCQIDNMFFYLNMAHTGSDDVRRLRDADGANIWLRINDIALATVPLTLLAQPKPEAKKRTRKKK